MKFIRKHKKISIVVSCILLIILVVSSVFAKYIYNIINNYIIESKHMYFYSSVLDINGKNYSISNWDGVNPQDIDVDLRNYKNDDRITDVDIEYTISVECPSTLTCSVTSSGTTITGGVIEVSEKTDNFIVTFGRADSSYKFAEDDKLPVIISVSSTSPYKKTIYGIFTVSIEQSDFSYSIEDSRNSLYATLILKNSVNYYKVKTGFTDDGKTYNADDVLTVEQYDALTNSTNKSKCFSAHVTISLPQDSGNVVDLKLDVTNKYFYNNNSTATYDSNGIVKGFEFDMNPSSTVEIIFYKDDVSQNYTYPITTSSSKVGVVATLASES